jgi:hypothetical protein
MSGELFGGDQVLADLDNVLDCRGFELRRRAR